MASPSPVNAAAFSEVVGQAWPVPVKNTFINFDLPALPSSSLRSGTCPPTPQTRGCNDGEIMWEEATQELCHAMAPRRRAEAHGRQQPEQGQVQVDAISQASTTSSEGTAEEAPEAPEAMHKQTWTSVHSKRRVKPSAEVLKPFDSQKPQAPRERASSRQRSEGKGKGLSYFTRVEVGIEDDRDFRVVQRLIGPRGRNMQDIVYKARGAKVWIIGRGSRSWEDDAGPLMVCVGAPTEHAFDIAVGLVRALLAKVREDNRKFRR